MGGRPQALYCHLLGLGYSLFPIFPFPSPHSLTPVPNHSPQPKSPITGPNPSPQPQSPITGPNPSPQSPIPVPNVCLSVCVCHQPENLPSYILLLNPECSIMSQNACRKFQNLQECIECSTQVPTSIIFVKKMAQRCGVRQIKRMTS